MKKKTKEEPCRTIKTISPARVAEIIDRYHVMIGIQHFGIGHRSQGGIRSHEAPTGHDATGTTVTLERGVPVDIRGCGIQSDGLETREVHPRIPVEVRHDVRVSEDPVHDIAVARVVDYHDRPVKRFGRRLESDVVQTEIRLGSRHVHVRDVGIRWLDARAVELVVIARARTLGEYTVLESAAGNRSAEERVGAIRTTKRTNDETGEEDGDGVWSLRWHFGVEYKIEYAGGGDTTKEEGGVDPPDDDDETKTTITIIIIIITSSYSLDKAPLVRHESNTRPRVPYPQILIIPIRDPPVIRRP